MLIAVRSSLHLLNGPNIDSQLKQIRRIVKDSRLQQPQAIGLQEEGRKIRETVKNTPRQDLYTISVENKAFQGHRIAE